MEQNWFKKRAKYFIILALCAVLVVLLCIQGTRQVLYGLFGYAIYAYLTAIVVACIFWMAGRTIQIKKSRILLYLGLFFAFLVTLHVGLTKSMMGNFSNYIVGTFEVGTPGGVFVALLTSPLAVPLGYLPTLIIFFVLTAGLGLLALLPLLILQEKDKKSGVKIKKVEQEVTPTAPKMLNEAWDDTSSAIYPTTKESVQEAVEVPFSAPEKVEQEAYQRLFESAEAKKSTEAVRAEEPRPTLIPVEIPKKSAVKTDYYTQNSFMEKSNRAFDKLQTDPDTYYRLKYAEENSAKNNAASEPVAVVQEPIFTAPTAQKATPNYGYSYQEPAQKTTPNYGYSYQEPAEPAFLDVEDTEDTEAMISPAQPRSSGGSINTGAETRAETTAQPSKGVQNAQNTEKVEVVERVAPLQPPRVFVQKPYMAPPVDLLDPDTDIASGEIEDYGTRKEIIESTIRAFDIEGTVVNAVKGPAVTRYELKLAPGTNVKKINGVRDNLMMNLAVANLAILAPIKGKPLVGVEVPNIKRSKVSFRTLVNTPEFNKKEGKVVFAIGKTVDNRPYVFDMVDAPHMLVAGSTGSGKSVCINTIILSLLYRYSPEDMRFIMIDPKRVELAPYTAIPHMLIKNPIIEVQQAVNVLKWACVEMDNRYRFLNQNGTRDIDSYNKNVRKPEEPKMFRVIIFIDEMADLMMGSKGQVETSIVRIAQLGRAAGIHLVLATQRPSANVLTGLIKANISTSIAFTVKSNLESRIIMDDGGAEALLGKGDLYFTTPKETDKVRMQGAFVDEPEIKRVCAYVREHNEAHFDDTIEAAVAVQEPVDTDEAAEKVSAQDEGEHNMNALLKNVMRTFIIMQRASVSLAQMKHAIGYMKASRVVARLEELGCISEEDGKNSRRVLISLEELDKIFPPEDGEEKDYE